MGLSIVLEDRHTRLGFRRIEWRYDTVDRDELEHRKGPKKTLFIPMVPCHMRYLGPGLTTPALEAMVMRSLLLIYCHRSTRALMSAVKGSSSTRGIFCCQCHIPW